ncbi:MAG: hypothetical protein SVO01_09215, partial [Thermotogota bacterium]|nr:hypothetical protein [Thermotogota bacterium]
MEEPYPYLNMLENEKDFIFLTDHGEKNLFKNIRVNVLDLIAERKFLKIFPQWLLEGLFLFFLGIAKKDVVFVTFGANKRAYVLMILQWLFRPFITPKVHVMFGCLWEPRKGIFGKIIICIRRYLVHNVVEKCIVNGKTDIESFNRVLGISKDKLVFFPYHHTLHGFKYNVVDGDYIFAGGTDGRDYDLLMKICDELSLPLKIATLDQDVIKKASNYQFADVKTVTPQEYRDLMAGSRIVTIPYGKSIILRTGGHQTMVNAMLMGKPL